MSTQLNIYDQALEPCGTDPITGFYRDGHCRVGPEDHGCHAVCCQLTEAFLAYSKAQGNDLTTPMPEYHFPGLKPGDRWCVCASRWKEALDAGHACPIYLKATSKAALSYISKSQLEEYGIEEESEA